MIGSRRYVSRYPAPSPLHAWAQFAVDLPHSRCLMTEAARAAISGTVELDQSGGRQLMILVSLLRNIIKKHRQMHIALVSDWENEIAEKKKLSEMYNSFRLRGPVCHHIMIKVKYFSGRACLRS